MATIKNTAYKVHSGLTTDAERITFNIEEGAMVTTESGIWQVYNGAWRKLYPQAGIGAGIGWVRYDDTEYNSSNKLALTDGVEIKLPNNGGNIYTPDSVSYYDVDTEKLIGENLNDVYLLTVAFKASSPQALNTHLDFRITGVEGYDRINKVLVFAKGNNVEENFHEVYQYYVNQDFITNGAEMKISSDGGNASVWDIIYFIQKTQSYA